MVSLKNFYRKFFPELEPRVNEVEMIDDGFIARRRDGFTQKVYWQEIQMICTYKADCWSHDLICLILVTEKEEVDVPENAKNFEAFIAEVNQRFPDINGEWYFEVMQPPFVENFTVLCKREPSNA